MAAIDDGERKRAYNVVANVCKIQEDEHIYFNYRVVISPPSSDDGLLGTCILVEPIVTLFGYVEHLNFFTACMPSTAQ